MDFQQFPSSILKEMISTLEVKDKLVVVYLNKFFCNISSPILYKDVIYEHPFSKLRYADKGYEMVIQLMDASLSDTNLKDNSEPDFNLAKESIIAKLNEKYGETELQFQEKLWAQIEPSIKKHGKYVKKVKIINPSNLTSELEYYNNLKVLRLEINEQDQFDQLILNQSRKLEELNRLEIYIKNSLSSQFNRLVPHFINLKYIVVDLGNRNFNWIRSFKSDVLTCLDIKLDEINKDFFRIVKLNFKYLKRLHLKCHDLSWDSETDDLPIFDEVVDFTFTIKVSASPSGLSYLTDGNFWPNLKNLGAFYHQHDFPNIIKGNWSQLVRLATNLIENINLNQMEWLYRLKSLYLENDFTFKINSMKLILTELTNLKSLVIDGTISSKFFTVISSIQLHVLEINGINNISLIFINFIRSLTSCHTIKLSFTDRAFDNVNLPELLEGAQAFPNLRSVELKKVPDIFEKWFVSSSENLYKVVRAESSHKSKKYI